MDRTKKCAAYCDTFGECVRCEEHAGPHVGRMPGFSGPEVREVPDYFMPPGDHVCADCGAPAAVADDGFWRHTGKPWEDASTWCDRYGYPVNVKSAPST